GPSASLGRSGLRPTRSPARKYVTGGSRREAHGRVRAARREASRPEEIEEREEEGVVVPTGDDLHADREAGRAGHRRDVDRRQTAERPHEAAVGALRLVAERRLSRDGERDQDVELLQVLVHLVGDDRLLGERALVLVERDRAPSLDHPVQDGADELMLL